MAKAQTLTLTPSNYNGNNISCFGAQDGSINLTITGGTPPYTIRWSNDATTEDISNLAAGFYMVEVDDADTTTDMVSADITLTEPEALSVELTASDYIVNARHYNISLSGACNGSITPSVTGGTTPYTYNWEPYGQTTANLTNICAGGYNLNVTDANGCATPAQQDMTEPDRDDWQMTGNTGSNPTSNFIGTVDNQDLSLRTYNQERLRIKANGDFKINSLVGGTGMVYVDDDGVLRSYTTPSNCSPPPLLPAWNMVKPISNNAGYMWTCPQFNISIGDGNTPPQNVILKVSGNTYLTGTVGIGTATPQGDLEIKGTNPSVYVTDATTNATSINLKNADGFWKFTGPLSGESGKPLSVFWNNNITDTRIMSLMNNGTVSIGIDPNNINLQTTPYKLIVNGKLGVKDDIYVTNTGTWPDYVFEKEYSLTPLKRVESFLEEHKHLQGYPTAKDIESTGQQIGNLQMLQQKSIEELYLYIIKQEKRIEELERRVKGLRK